MVLAFSNSKHFGAAFRAHALSRRLPVFHGDFLRVLHFLLGAALHAVCFHRYTSFDVKDKLSDTRMSIVSDEEN